MNQTYILACIEQVREIERAKAIVASIPAIARQVQKAVAALESDTNPVCQESAHWLKITFAGWDQEGCDPRVREVEDRGE